MLWPVLCVADGGDWGSAGRQYSFALAMIILNMSDFSALLFLMS